MPIYESDPWREQYFTSVECPADVHIPTDDSAAFEFNPRHRWIYNKLLVAGSQGLECGPQGVAPPHYPVFCKPITNLKGMGLGSCVLQDERDYRERCKAGDFWMRLLSGEHFSSDWAVVNGRTLWCRHTLGITGAAGTFDYWIVLAQSRPGLESYCRGWIRRNLRDYTGMLNIETIGGRIIEAHLRFADQWPDMYGYNWVAAMVRLYQDRVWHFDDRARADGFSVVLFGPHGRRYSHPVAETLAAYRATPGISSVQITFFADRPSGAHAMPPGGFRLAVINTFNLDIGLRLRAVMARGFELRESASLERLAG